eukprot:7173926-Prymnesium_polylepis.4
MSDARRAQACDTRRAQVCVTQQPEARCVAHDAADTQPDEFDTPPHAKPRRYRARPSGPSAQARRERPPDD